MSARLPRRTPATRPRCQQSVSRRLSDHRPEMPGLGRPAPRRSAPQPTRIAAVERFRSSRQLRDVGFAPDDPTRCGTYVAGAWWRECVRDLLRAQVVIATASLSASDGVRHPRVCRGRRDGALGVRYSWHCPSGTPSEGSERSGALVLQLAGGVDFICAHEAVAHGEQRCAGSAGLADLGVDVLDVVADGLWRDRQPLSDLPV